MSDFNCENCIHREVCPGYQVTMPDCKQYKDESRFIELPCKVGDILYVTYEKSLEAYRITEIQIDEEIGLHFICYGGYVFYGVDIGKTVFLTPEEAEQALKEG